MKIKYFKLHTRENGFASAKNNHSLVIPFLFFYTSYFSQEMEISKSSSGSSESTMTSSWVLLDSSNIATKEDEGKNDKEKIEKAPEQSSTVDKDNTNDSTNNKSDAESDGISIISESEFFNGSSDEDDSASSNCGNITNDLNLIENVDEIHQNEEGGNNMVHQNHYDTSNECSSAEIIPLEPSTSRKNLLIEENSVEKEENSNISSVDNDPVIKETMTLCNVPEESINFSKELSDIVNKPHDKKSLNWTLKEIFMKFLQFNVVCFTCTILFAFLASCIPSKTNESSMNKANINSDKFKSQYIYEYCQNIHENNELNQDHILERCIEELMIEIKKSKKYREGKQYTKKEKLISANKYLKNKGAKTFNEYHTDKDLVYREKVILNEYEIQQLNKTVEDFRENESVSKMKLPKTNVKNHVSEKQFQPNKRKKEHWKEKKTNSKPNKAHKEKVLNEEEKLRNWEKILDKREKQLIKWEMKLLKREKKYHENKLLFHNLNRKKKSYKDVNIEKHKYQEIFPNNKNKLNKKSSSEKKTKLHKVPTKTSKNVKVSQYAKKNETSAFKNNKINGEWYINLSKSRNEIRKRDDKANWWFDRVNLRKIKRDKAFWYFNYMFNREDLRYNHKNF